MSERYVHPDVLFDIFVRLPVKSLCRLRCVSTQWNSIISDPVFIDAHFDRSANSNPTLLISVYDETAPRSPTLFSSAYFPNPNDHALTHDAPYCANLAGKFMNMQSLGGLVCMWFQRVDNTTRLEIYNPTTRTPVYGITIPSDSEDGYHYIESFFAYDPIGRVHKIVVVRYKTICGTNKIENSFDVLTLDDCKEWRNGFKYEGSGHLNASNSLCVGRELFYIAYNGNSDVPDQAVTEAWLVIFDVWSESFYTEHFETRNGDLRPHHLRLVEFSGLFPIFEGPFMTQIISIPSNWNEITLGHEVVLEGTAPSGELLFRHARPSDHFWLFYYNPDTQHAWRTEIPEVSERIMAARSVEDPPINGHALNFAVTLTRHRESLKK